MESDAWDACLESTLLRYEDGWQHTPEARRHGHALRRLFEEMCFDAVLCVEGSPTVCISNSSQVAPDHVEDVRRRLWNLDLPTLLIIENSNSVQVFSTFVKPTQQDTRSTTSLLSDETIENLDAVQLALRLRQLILRIETGAIYRDHKSLFDPHTTVNRQLLENLNVARDLICPQSSKVGYQRAHALIGRFLFSCYLLDRGIIGPRYLSERGLPEARDVLNLLRARPQKVATLQKLFRALQTDFNGSLFGDAFMVGSLKRSEVECLERLLAGEDLNTGQLSLFKLYDFSFIPIELISSIYEDFIGAEAAVETGANPPNQRRNTGQRLQGAYYTPPRLAELTVDIATEGWDTLLDKRCLDPACGSGIFLVILFVRMAEEWRRRNPEATTSQRFESMMRLLEDNLYGIDIQPTACLVTCFSLYLALLDQMKPCEIMEVLDASERDTRTKLLPQILWEQGKPRPSEPHFTTVREFDFFALDSRPEFDLVIGNPPWVSRKRAPSAEAWLFSGSNPYARQVGWTDDGTKPTAKETAALFPAKELACAFMWKAGLHLRSSGRVCQLLPSRVFLSSNTDRFQLAWLKQHRLETVWLLADYSFILFPTASCPCFVGRYHPRNDEESPGDFEFVTPKVELLDPRQALIPIMPEDRKFLAESEILAAAERKEAAGAWKAHLWGTPRDARLIERLLRLPRLSRIAKSPPSNPDLSPSERGRLWFIGQGFQPASASTTKPKDIVWKRTDLFLPAKNAATSKLILLRQETRPIGNLYRDTGLRRKPSPLLYRAPLLLVNQAFTKFLFSDFDVLFQHDFQSICAPAAEEDRLLFLTAYLASPLAQYLVFHTTANIGVERDKVLLKELLELPFPLPADMPNRRKCQDILARCANRMRKLQTQLADPTNFFNRDAFIDSALNALAIHVYEYFDLSEWERHLVEDTVEIFRPSSTPASLESEKLFTAQPSTWTDREQYAATLIKTFHTWSRTKKHLWAEGCLSPRANLGVITLSVGRRTKPYSESNMSTRVEEILKNIREASAEDDGSVFHRLRGFIFYESDCVHILKPLSLRHWTRTAALNDADEILTRMMEEGGWDA